jgi:hypothetical protein
LAFAGLNLSSGREPKGAPSHASIAAHKLGGLTALASGIIEPLRDTAARATTERRGL